MVVSGSTFGLFAHLSIILFSCVFSYCVLVVCAIIFVVFLIKYKFSVSALYCHINKHSMVRWSVKYVFGLLNEDTDDAQQITLFNFKVPELYVSHLFFTTIYMCLSAIALFWIKFVIQEVPDSYYNSYSSVCFKNNTILCSATDCSKPGGTLICYMFVFDFGDALEESIGLLAFYLASLIICAIILLGLSGGKSGSMKRKCLATTIHISMFLSVVSVSGAFAAIIFYTFEGGHYYQASLKLYYVLQIFVGLLCGLAIPWWKFEKVPRTRASLEISEHTSFENMVKRKPLKEPLLAVN